jgi:hypothetical protein
VATRHRGFTRKKFLEAVGADSLLHFLRHHRGLDVALPDIGSQRAGSASPGEDHAWEIDGEKVDKLLATLPLGQQQEIGEEFQCINDVSDKGMDYLVRSCQDLNLDIPEWPPERIAMLLFLEYPQSFRMAYDLYSWRASANTMSHHQFRPSEAVIGDSALGRFQASVVAFFGSQGKGEDCKIRHYEEDGAHLLLVARGDHMQTLSVWEGGNERTTFSRPVREDLLRYDPDRFVLSIKAYGRSSAEVAHYVETWATNVLGRNQAELFVGSVVSLEPIRSGKFRYDGDEEVESVTLVEVRMTLHGSTELNMRASSADVLQSLQLDLRSISLARATLHGAKLSFKLKHNGPSGRPVLVEVAPPNVTRFNRRRDEAIINAYLRREEVLLG